MRASPQRLSLITLGLLAALTSGCVPPAPKTVSLRMTGPLRDASVTINDQLIGPLILIEKRGVALPKGRHTITVEKSGYFPFDTVVEATEAPIMIKVELVKIPD